MSEIQPRRPEFTRSIADQSGNAIAGVVTLGNSPAASRAATPQLLATPPPQQERRNADYVQMIFAGEAQNDQVRRLLLQKLKAERRVGGDAVK